MIDLIKNIKSNYSRMVLSAFLNFISTITFARMLGPSQYGTYTYLLWFSGTLAIFLGLGLDGTITKFFPLYYLNNQFLKSKRFLRSLFIIQIITIFPISIILLISFPLWQSLFKDINSKQEFLLVFLSIMNVLPTALLTLSSSVVKALQRFDIFSRIAIRAQIFGFILNIVMVLVFHEIKYLLITLFIISTIQVFLYVKFINRDLKNSISRFLIKKRESIDKKRIYKYSKYMYINIIWQQVVYTRSEYLFLGIYSGPKEVAIYGLAYGLVNIVGLIFSPIMNVLNNFFSSLVAKQDFQLLEGIVVSFTKYFIILLFFLLTYAFAFSETIINIIYSNQYHGAVISFLVMLSGLVIVQGISVAGSLPFLYEKQKFLVNMGIVAAIINIIFDIVFIPRLGALGAAIANSTTQVISIIIEFIYVIKITGFKFKLINLMPFIFLSIFFCTVICYSHQFIIKFMLIILYTLLYLSLLFFKKVISRSEIAGFIGQLK